MSVFSKVKTHIFSNINELISKSEKPEKMLNQLISEMNDQLADTKKAVAMAVADEKKLENEKNSNFAQAKNWEHKAILAVKKGKDDIAKEALLQKQETENAAAEFQRQWESQKISVEQLKEGLRELQNKIEEAQRKKNLLIARTKRAEAREKIQDTISGVSGNRSAFEAFDRVSVVKIDQIEATADISGELEDLKKNAGPEKSDTTADALLLELKEKIKTLPKK